MTNIGSNDTLVDTSFQLISDFFQGVLCFEHAKQASLLGGGGGGGATGLLNKGGGSNRLPGLVPKQQAVEFPQVQASILTNLKKFFAGQTPRFCRILLIFAGHPPPPPQPACSATWPPYRQLATSVLFSCHMPLHFMNEEIIATNAVYQ